MVRSLSRQWWGTFWPSFFYYSPAAVLQYTCRSVTSLLPTSFLLFGHEAHGCPHGPKKKKENDESKIHNRQFHLQEIQNLDSPRQSTENCTAINWLSFNLSSRIYALLFSYNGSYFEIPCLTVYFCCLVLQKCYLCCPTVDWLTNK